MYPLETASFDTPFDLLELDNPLVGRTAELTQIKRIFDTFLHVQTSSISFLSGALGIGKTRLLHEVEHRFLHNQEKIKVIRSRATAHQKEIAYSLITAILRNTIEEKETPISLPSDLNALIPQLEAYESPCEATVDFTLPPTDPQLIVDRIRITVLEWFEKRCKNGPLILLLEDLQWADRSSFRLLEELLLRQSQNLCILACARDELWSRFADPFLGANTNRIRLTAFTHAEVDCFLNSIKKSELPPRIQKAIHDLSLGNPFFARQLLRSFEEREETSARDALSLPISIEAAIQSRLDHLPTFEKELCKSASILQRAFSTDEIAALLNRPKSDVHRCLVSLIRREFLCPQIEKRGPRRFSFRSSIVGDVAYRLLSEEKRKEQHLCAARLFSQNEFHDPGGNSATFRLWWETYAGGSALCSRLYALSTSRRCVCSSSNFYAGHGTNASSSQST